MSEIKTVEPISLACPECRRLLQSGENRLQCSDCHRIYPIVEDIPDFLSQDHLARDAKRIAKAMDFMAPIYKSRLFASVSLKLSGIGNGSRYFNHLADFHAETLNGIKGVLLDVACGPATYTRRIAYLPKQVYGIDISMGVLRLQCA